MKGKNQPASNELEAKEKLIVYVYDYLNASNAKGAAKLFLEEINYNNNIQINQDGPGFLVDWWCVFWDLYSAASDKRTGAEPSSEARVFHDYNMRTVMSPSCPRTSPPQSGPQFMGGRGMMPDTRYVSMRGGAPVNVGPRMQGGMGGGVQGMPPQMGVVPHGPPHGPPMMGAASPRYVPHPGHMTPGSSASSGPMGPEPGPSPGMNRMTPNHSASPHTQIVGPPNGMGGPMGGPPGGPHVGPPPVQTMGPQGGPVQGMQPRGVPPQNWQNNFNVNSPADPQQCFMPGPPVSQGQQGEFGGMMMSDGGMMDVKPANNNGPPNQQQDEYVMYGQQSDQGEAGPEIMKLKESLENNTKEYNDNDQTGFSNEYSFT